MTLMSFQNIQGGYQDTRIIENISGSLGQGQVLGVFGRNGVGKTTLARLLNGTLPLENGQISVSGKRIDHLPSHNRRAAGIGYFSQSEGVFHDLSVRENLHLISNSISPEIYFEHFPRLQERLDQRAGLMSGGERKILGFVRAMLEDTRVVILDEPSEGVQPENIHRMATLINEEKSKGRSFILIEQNLEMLLQVADHYLGMDGGAVVLSKDAAKTSKDDMLKILQF
jgi:urea transport system ATP-binding protein